MAAGDSDVVADAIADSKYAADISRKMQVPDRLTLSGGGAGAKDTAMMGGFRGGGGGGGSGGNGGGPADLASSWSNVASAKMMQVPDRILLAGNNAHVAARSTPRELQLENSVMPTSPEHVRVYTPPRSIRLDDNSAFPAVPLDGGGGGGDLSDDDILEQSYNGGGTGAGAGHRMPAATAAAPNFVRTGSSGTGQLSSSLGKENSFMAMASGQEMPQQQQNLTTFEELQLVRRQIAKLNHRLMAVELENQQQQQREMIFTVLVTAYFFGKFIFWVNRNT